MSAPTPTIGRSSEPRPRGTGGRVRRWLIAGLVLVAVVVTAVVLWLTTGDDGSEEPVPSPDPATEPVGGEEGPAPGEEEATPGEDEPTAGDDASQVGAGLPTPAAETAQEIHALAQAGDLDGLARLALAGEGAFSASFGDPVTTPEQLVALWQGIGVDEVLAAMEALVALPDWYPLAGSDAAGDEITLHVTPRFMHDPTDAHRAALEGALGAEAVEADLVGGDWYGWRLGIDDAGDWRFFVRGD